VTFSTWNYSTGPVTLLWTVTTV